MTAREYFENVRAAQRRIDGCLARVEAMRSREGVRAQRYDAIGKSYGGDHDVMRMTDARIDAESRIASEIAELRSNRGGRPRRVLGHTRGEPVPAASGAMCWSCATARDEGLAQGLSNSMCISEAARPMRTTTPR